MLQFKGTFEVDVEGRKVGFRFGPGAAMFTEQSAGYSITEYFRRFAQGQGSGCLLHFFYGGHKFYLLTKLEQVKQMVLAGGSETAMKERDRLQAEFDQFSIVNVSDLLEKIGLDEALRIHNEALGLPNLKAPSETGPQTSESTGSETTTKSESQDLTSAPVSSGS